jgi:hypothetical protein
MLPSFLFHIFGFSSASDGVPDSSDRISAFVSSGQFVLRSSDEFGAEHSSEQFPGQLERAHEQRKFQFLDVTTSSI